jgi:hypothetical protein
MNEKRCSKCERVFPANKDFFYAQTRNLDGLRPNCRWCHKSFKNTGVRRPTNLTKEERRVKRRTWEREYRRNNIGYKIAKSCRVRLWLALKDGFYKKNSTFSLIGCTPNELKKYLESKFLDGMTWENYGFEGWHIDHIRPCSTFDLSNPQEQAACFHYTNLQPLWAQDNMLKRDKWPCYTDTTV